MYAAIERRDCAGWEKSFWKRRSRRLELDKAVGLVCSCGRVWKAERVCVWAEREVEVETAAEEAGESDQGVQQSWRLGATFDCFPLNDMRDE